MKWRDILLALCIVASTSFAQTASYNGEWRGKYSCGPALHRTGPGVGAFSVNVTLSVGGAQAALAREDATVKEVTEGTVKADGALALQGTGRLKAGNSAPWRTRFDGKFQGSVFSATGVIDSPDGSTKYRECTLVLHRSSPVQATAQTQSPASTDRPPTVAAVPENPASTSTAPKSIPTTDGTGSAGKAAQVAEIEKQRLAAQEAEKARRAELERQVRERKEVAARAENERQEQEASKKAIAEKKRLETVEGKTSQTAIEDRTQAGKASDRGAKGKQNQNQANTQVQPVAFKVDMGYKCSTKKGDSLLRIYGSNGRFFQQVFRDDTLTTESMVKVNVGKWKVKNINENGDQAVYDRVYTLDIKDSVWDVVENRDGRKLYEDVALSKSKKDLFYVVNESRTDFEIVCQENSGSSSNMLKIAEEYAKRSTATAERYSASANVQAQASARLCGRKPLSGEQIHDPELQKIIDLAITNFKKMRTDAEARGNLACVPAQNAGKYGGKQLNEAIQRYNSAMTSGSAVWIAAEKGVLLIHAQNSCNVIFEYYKSCNPAAFK